MIEFILLLLFLLGIVSSEVILPKEFAKSQFALSNTRENFSPKNNGFRLATFNVGRLQEMVKGNDPVNSLVKDIKQMGPDVISLQEVPELKTGEIMQKLKGSGYNYIRYASTPLRDFGVAVISKHPISDAKSHLMFDRRLLDTTIDYNGKKVQVVSVHLSHKFDAFRNMQMQKAVQLLDEGATDGVHGQFIVGDFNSDPRTMLSQGESKNLDVHATESSTHWRDTKVDYIISRKESGVQSPAVVFKTPTSDHLPVMADFNPDSFKQVAQLKPRKRYSAPPSLQTASLPALMEKNNTFK